MEIDLFIFKWDGLISNEENSFVYPVNSVLDDLSIKNKIAVLSVHPEEDLLSKIREYWLDQQVSLVCGNSKNKTRELTQICTQMLIHPKKSLYVGNTVSDIRAAHSTGLKSAGIATSNHKIDSPKKEKLKTEYPNLLLESLTELKKYF